MCCCVSIKLNQYYCCEFKIFAKDTVIVNSPTSLLYLHDNHNKEMYINTNLMPEILKALMVIAGSD